MACLPGQYYHTQRPRRRPDTEDSDAIRRQANTNFSAIFVELDVSTERVNSDIAPSEVDVPLLLQLHELHASSKRFALVSPPEPILQHQNVNISISDKLNSVFRLINRLEGILIVREATAGEEC